MPFALVHYHELALKGRNRGLFEQRLIQHLRHSLRHTGVSQVESLPGRIRVRCAGACPAGGRRGPDRGRR